MNEEIEEAFVFDNDDIPVVTPDDIQLGLTYPLEDGAIKGYALRLEVYDIPFLLTPDAAAVVLDFIYRHRADLFKELWG